MSKEANRTRIKFSALQCIFWLVWAPASYQTVVLQNAGLDSTQIGNIFALAAAVSLIATPLMGVLSDMLRSAKLTVLFSTSAMAVLYAFLPGISKAAASTVVMIYIYVAVIYMFRQPAYSLMDSWCLSALNPHGINYSIVRKWGSLGYFVFCVFLGQIVDVYVTVDTIFLWMIPLTILFIVVGLSKDSKPETLPENAGAPAEASAEVPAAEETAKAKADLPEASSGSSRAKTRKVPLSSLFRNKAFLFYTIYTFGLHIYTGITVAFIPYLLTAANCATSHSGTAAGVRALFEVAAMVTAGFLVKKLPLKYILLISGIFFTIENVLYQFSNGMFSILVCMAFSGFAGGIFYSMGPAYVSSIVSEDVASTAQSCNAMVMSFVNIVGAFIGGYVIDIWGIHALTNGQAVLILVLTAIFTGSIMKLRPAKTASA